MLRVRSNHSKWGTCNDFEVATTLALPVPVGPTFGAFPKCTVYKIGEGEVSAMKRSLVVDYLYFINQIELVWIQASLVSTRRREVFEREARRQSAWRARINCQPFLFEKKLPGDDPGVADVRCRVALNHAPPVSRLDDASRSENNRCDMKKRHSTTQLLGRLIVHGASQKSNTYNAKGTL